VTRGTNVTVVPVSVHVPWSVTSMEFMVQPVEMVSDAAHNFNVDVLNATVPCVVYSDGVMPAESLESGVKFAVMV